jgi:hypothetical protein
MVFHHTPHFTAVLFEKGKKGFLLLAGELKLGDQPVAKSPELTVLRGLSSASSSDTGSGAGARLLAAK